MLTICLPAIKWFHLLLFNTNNSIQFNIDYLFTDSELLIFITNYSFQYDSFICSESNGSKYCDVITIFRFRHTVKEFQVLLSNTNNSIELYSFICTVKWFQVLLCITNNSIRHKSFFVQSLNVKHFYLTH